MKNLKIDIPEGYEIDEQKSTFSEIIFKKKSGNIRERIQIIKDVFDLNNTTEEEFYQKWRDFDNFEIGGALERLIVKAYNEGKEPDWRDNSYKYSPYFHMDKFHLCCVSAYCSTSDVGALSVFLGKDGELNCKDAVSKFLKEYKLSRLGV